MKRSLLLAGLLVTLIGSARAQETVGIIDSVLMHTERAFNQDRPLFRVFGFGFEYTDSIDYRLPSGRREAELPTFPPASFFAMFDAQHSSEPAWIDRDIRGIPDSVKGDGVRFFSLRYVLDVQYGEASQITLVMPRGLPRGIDSINFRDVFGGGGLVFNETISGSQPDSVVVPENLEPIAMIVYYDMDQVTSGIRDVIAERSGRELRLVPNPATDRVWIETPLPAGTRVALSDVRGTTLLDDRLGEATNRLSLDVGDYAHGLYFVRAIGPDGALLAESRLKVVE